MTLLKTTALLVGSNFFMLCAWYLHPRLKFLEGRTIAAAILVSWGIAFFEYVLQVPANRIGYAGGISFYQLKFLQEIITLAVFVPFALLFLHEKLTWNYVWAGLCLCAAGVLCLLRKYDQTAFLDDCRNPYQLRNTRS